MESDETLHSILQDVAFMRIAGMCPIVVHGGGKAISRALEEEGIETEFIMGLRVTDATTRKVVERVIRSEVNIQVVTLLRSFGVMAEPLHGGTVFLSEIMSGTDPSTGKTIDWGFVGNPVFTDTGPAREMFARGVIPVVYPLGRGIDGEILNINADTAAAAFAKALSADKLAFVSDVPGLLENANEPNSLISTLRASDAPALMSRGIVGGGMLPKIQSCLDALEAGVRKVHLVDGRMPHSLLLEIFTNNGVGTEITK